MKKKDSLLELIRSLSMNEKRYFKVFASRHIIGEENIYVKLFDILDKQKERDEKDILKEISHVTTKAQSSNKYYLYRLILKSLLAFHSENSVNAQLKELSRSIEILFDKGLYDQCGKLISKAYKLADQYENLYVLHELLDWQIKIAFKQDYNNANEDLTKIFDIVFDLLNKTRNSAHYNYLISKMFLKIGRDGLSREKKDFDVYEKIMQHPLLKSDTLALTYTSKYHFYLLQSAYYFVQDNFSQAHECTQKLVNLFENNPQQLQINPKQYLFILNNLIICELNLKKYKQLPKSIDKLKALKISNVSIEIFYIINNIELVIFGNMGDFDKGVELIHSIEPHIKNNINSLSYAETALFYNISYIYFGVGKYVMALHWLNKILNTNNLEIDPASDLYCHAKIYNIIIHYELSNQDLLDYIIKGTYQFLYKKKRLYKIETLVLNFIKNKSAPSMSRRELSESFKGLHSELLEISKDPFEKKALKYFDWISWLESKIQNRSFAEIIKEKSGVSEDNGD